MIEDACVTSNECMRGTNSYTCRNDNYQDTNPHNCTIIRENCKYSNLCIINLPNKNIHGFHYEADLKQFNQFYEPDKLNKESLEFFVLSPILSDLANLC